ncbi:MAG TPA: hypothetical protein VFP11_00075, partial [Candidatus Angelobacter sp.]|nr:hypothetical protein [Candidatus Angelobacter sp.]
TQQVGPGAGTDVGRVNCGLGIVRSRNNGGFSDYHALQTEFRFNNLFKQLSGRMGYTWSKNLDNVSEIFATGTAGNTLFAAQNPFQTGDAERSISGLNITHAGYLQATEVIPFFKEQRGWIGHMLGGWQLSAAYVYGSGQPYTPVQGLLGSLSFAGAGGNYFDSGFSNAFVGDPARMFLGSSKAPATSIGIYAGDARTLGLISAAQLTALGPTALLSMNAFNAPAAADPRGCIRGAAACVPVVVTQNDVRFIMNGRTAQGVFGTPFGNTPRNPLTDAPQNRLDATIFKSFKLGEHKDFEVHMTATNALNHFNYSSIDPTVEDAGLTQADIRLFGVGFGLPSQTSANGNNGGSRVVSISGKFTF